METHIIRNVPPQSAVQERFVGSVLERRPSGPKTRPRRLHSTTRRTTQQMTKHTPHLEKQRHEVTFGSKYLHCLFPFFFLALIMSVCTCRAFTWYPRRCWPLAWGWWCQCALVPDSSKCCSEKINRFLAKPQKFVFLFHPAAPWYLKNTYNTNRHFSWCYWNNSVN